MALFAGIPVPVDAFVPTLTAMLFVNHTVTATLLFSQFSISRSRAIFVLANGYLITALIVISFALTFPGAFSLTGLLDAGLQSTAGIYQLWH
jgi:hypothetical protein